MRSLFVILLAGAMTLLGSTAMGASATIQGNSRSPQAPSASGKAQGPSAARAPKLVRPQGKVAAPIQRPAAAVARARAARPPGGQARSGGASFRRILGFPPLVPGGQQAIPITTNQATIAWMQRVASPADNGFNLPSTLTGGYGEVFSITVASTGLTEFFALLVPAVPSGQQAPLVVGFHGANTTYLDITRTTELINEAAARNWFFLAPIQQSAVGNGQVHYGSVQSQLHVEALLELLLRAYPIDLDRIYGVGFSMGGGAALSYGARHRNRELGAFAAIVNHTGTVALSHVYDSEPLIRPEMELLFGGPPPASLFEYQRSSVIEMDASGQLLPQGRHMAENLGAVPTQTWYATDDSLTYLQTQCVALDGFFQGLPGSSHRLLPRLADPQCFTNNLGGHCWATLDPVAAYDWLELQSLELDPPFGSVLADRGGQWGLYDVTQGLPDRFTSFGFNVDLAQGVLTLSDLENVRTINVDLEEHGFLASSPTSIVVNSADGTAHSIEVRGLAGRPAAMTRNGLGALESCVSVALPTWCYDATTGTLVIEEPFGAPSNWTIIP